MAFNEERVLTAYHVVRQSGNRLLVIAPDGTRYAAVVFGFDEEQDLAVVVAPNLKAKPLVFSEQVSVGESVYAIGYALGFAGEASVTRGIVSARRYEPDTRRTLIQTDAPINPGNSGGPLVNDQGKAVGVNVVRLVGRTVPIQNVGFAVSAADVLKMSDFLLSGGKRLVIGATPTPTHPNPTPDSPVPGPLEVVARYYTSIDRRDYQTAWGLMTREFVQTYSYGEFVSWFKDKVSIQVEQSERAWPGDAPDRYMVQVIVVSTDRIDGNPITSRVRESWALRREGTWKVDRYLGKEILTPTVPSPARQVLREYPERRQDGGMYLVQQWSDGSFTVPVFVRIDSMSTEVVIGWQGFLLAASRPGARCWVEIPTSQSTTDEVIAGPDGRAAFSWTWPDHPTVRGAIAIAVYVNCIYDGRSINDYRSVRMVKP
ncbi:MAG: trypsin-like peptidase domain-containing protein [Chloroflexi bacterium]|nr:trypsin-like peptidase domain-containing protein [Chloroflexota bacterium]